MTADPHTTTAALEPYSGACESMHREQRQRTQRLRRPDRWPSRAARLVLLCALAGLVLGFLAGCCSLSAEGQKALSDGWATNAGDARDESLAPKERSKGAMNARVLRLLAEETRTPLPAPLESEGL